MQELKDYPPAPLSVSQKKVRTKILTKNIDIIASVLVAVYVRPKLCGFDIEKKQKIPSTIKVNADIGSEGPKLIVLKRSKRVLRGPRDP